MRYAPFPVVGAPAGMALGGGCEILLHCAAVQAHAETYIGLVECGVGLVPGWGGCKEMLTRWRTPSKLPKGPMPAVGKAFETISTATVSKSAAEAKEYAVPAPDRRHHHEPRPPAGRRQGQGAWRWRKTTRPPEPPHVRLPGPPAASRLDMAVDGFHKRGMATEHDMVVSDALADVLTGGETDHHRPDDRGRCHGARTHSLHAADPHEGHALARIEAHAGNRQAAAQLTEGTNHMPAYKAPLRDMRFVLHELHDSDDLAKLPGYEEMTPDLIDTVLEEAAKFCAEKCCCRSTPAATRKAAPTRTAWCARPRASRRPTTRSAKAAGRPGRDPEYGGQGLPETRPPCWSRR